MFPAASHINNQILKKWQTSPIDKPIHDKAVISCSSAGSSGCSWTGGC